MSRSDAAAERARQAEENRRKFPRTFEVMVAMRKVFGDGIKLIWASEGGHEIGKKGTK